jgi:hypothetical protein
LSPQSTALLPPEHGLAYWGIAYLKHLGNSREVFRCPTAKIVDQWREDGLRYPALFWLNSTYGINAYAVQPPGPSNPRDRGTGPRKLSGFPSPQTTIFTQDAAEQRMDGGADDTIGFWPGDKQMLTQWRFDLSGLYPGTKFEWEWFRHNRRCNTLWLPGNVSTIKFIALTKGVDYRWYTGEPPLEQPKF